MKRFSHYIYHFIFANIGLYVVSFVYGSITVWEVLLFFFMTYLPFLDELFFCAVGYAQKQENRLIVNFFLAGNLEETFYLLHKKRKHFSELIIHNIPVYVALSVFLYVLLVFDLAVLFYAVAGVLTHLVVEMVTDEYEFESLTEWMWPLRTLPFMNKFI